MVYNGVIILITNITHNNNSVDDNGNDRNTASKQPYQRQHEREAKEQNDTEECKCASATGVYHDSICVLKESLYRESGTRIPLPHLSEIVVYLYIGGKLLLLLLLIIKIYI